MFSDGFKPVNSCQIMIEDENNSLLGIDTVAFVLGVNAGYGSCNEQSWR